MHSCRWQADQQQACKTAYTEVGASEGMCRSGTEAGSDLPLAACESKSQWLPRSTCMTTGARPCKHTSRFSPSMGPRSHSGATGEAVLPGTQAPPGFGGWSQSPRFCGGHSLSPAASATGNPICTVQEVPTSVRVHKLCCGPAGGATVRVHACV